MSRHGAENAAGLLGTGARMLVSQCLAWSLRLFRRVQLASPGLRPLASGCYVFFGNERASSGRQCAPRALSLGWVVRVMQCGGKAGY